MSPYRNHKERIPDSVEDPADVDLKGVPPRIRILLVQHLKWNERNISSISKQKKQMDKG
jgi:hypothetical protein